MSGERRISPSPSSSHRCVGRRSSRCHRAKTPPTLRLLMKSRREGWRHEPLAPEECPLGSDSRALCIGVGLCRLPLAGTNRLHQLDALFASLQLFSLGTSISGPDVPWTLNVARFMAHLSDVTNNMIYDALGSILIGAVLMLFAFFLAKENRGSSYRRGNV